ncbi:MAG: glutamate--tRNA ligase, partial [Gemmatimonadetes bacterium]|nr:glutamate--tRNA ligase [Gemmatimonadota bacterium]
VAAVLPRSRTTLDVVRQARLRAGLDPVTLDEKAAAHVAGDEAGHARVLGLAVAALRGLSDWSAEGLEAELRRLADAQGMKAGGIMQPIRIALTGSTVSEPVNVLLVAVGRDEAVRRLEIAARA